MMIQGFTVEDGHLHAVPSPLDEAQRVVWFDVLDPSQDESQALRDCLGVDLPDREAMEEIEDSSRLYTDGSTSFLTAVMPVNIEGALPEMSSITFILTSTRLVTVRYHEPRAFQNFVRHAGKVHLPGSTAEAVFLALLDAVVDRLADILEISGRSVMRISRNVLRSVPAAGDRTDFRAVLVEIGQLGEVVSNVQESLVSLERLIVFAGSEKTGRAITPAAMDEIKSLSRDARFLSEHAGSLVEKIGILLDATLGMIGIEQNNISRILSVAAALFLPATLIASIYGMNFTVMPELHWFAGYPVALLLMLGSAYLSWRFFKRRGWL
jgi:magnesium transporter